MIYDGIEGVSVDDATGELVIQTKWGEMRDAAPVAYQEIEDVRKEVDVLFRLMGENRVGFAVEDYDPNFMLTLDPGYSTYLGGSSRDVGYDIAVDSNGNAYVTGFTESSNFPTKNPLQESYAGNEDVFVTKLNISGNVLVYSTYIGGSSQDRGNGIAVDSSGNAYVTGQTASSSDFPSLNAYQSTYGGGSADAFVIKLSGSGALNYSTYIGGSSQDVGRGIGMDSSENVYVTGFTESSDFPTQNPFQENYAGSRDVFVTKLNISGNVLVYSTYIGGSSDEDVRGFAVDSSGNAYATGYTGSSNFPTQNPFQGSNAGSADAFVTKVDTMESGNDSLVYSTYIGGSSHDWGRGIAVDSSGNANVTGYTDSTDFPTQNPLQGDQESTDAFITKLSNSGALNYSTYIGGSNGDRGYDIAVDSSGNVYVTGYTASSNFLTQNPYQGSNAGGSDVFVAKLSSIGNTLVYSTYLGGSGNDYGWGISVDSSGNAYVTGYTGSSNFPTQNPFQESFSGYYDVFAASYLQDGSLPVELSLLTATASADGVLIRWRTETEVNNAGFSIYRSEEEDGNYVKVAFVKGAGNSGMPIDYKFTDKKAEPGKTYFYYLEDIDVTGEKSKSEIIKVVIPPAQPVEPIPKEFRLLQNYPNPFNPETWLPYELAKEARVTICIYDVNGQLVCRLELSKQEAGSYIDKEKAAYWDGKDQTGKSVSSGLYFYTLKAGDFQATRRMLIVK